MGLFSEVSIETGRDRFPSKFFGELFFGVKFGWDPNRFMERFRSFQFIFLSQYFAHF
jgi:hypothetical protein